MSDTPRTDAKICVFSYLCHPDDACWVPAELSRQIERELNAFHTHLSAVMPPDFKDWHQNSKLEWPQIAAEVIKNLRIDRDKGWEMAAKNSELDNALAKIHRLEQAGDGLLTVMRGEEGTAYCEWIGLAYDAEQNWIKAKEGNP